MPRKLTVTARTIISPPHKAQKVSEEESQGRHLDTGGARKHNRRARTATSLASWTDNKKRRLPKTLRDHVRSACASALSVLKKSLVANLSVKRQLSVAKLSAKRIFSLAKRDFLVANGRMAADFSSPAIGNHIHLNLTSMCGFSLNPPPPPPSGQTPLIRARTHTHARMHANPGKSASYLVDRNPRPCSVLSAACSRCTYTCTRFAIFTMRAPAPLTIYPA